MDPITGALLTQAGGQLLGGLFKPKNNPYMDRMKMAADRKASYIPYFNDLVNKGQKQQNMFLPQAQKMANMGIEQATKPLTETDVFRGVSPVTSMLQRQGDQVNANIANSASQRGLYGPNGAGVGTGYNPNAAMDASIAGTMGQFANDWYNNQGNRLNNAAQLASGMANQGTGMMTQGIGGAQGTWDSYGRDMQSLGEQQMNAENLAQQQHGQFMNLLQGYWGQQNQNSQIAKQINAWQQWMNMYGPRASGNVPASDGKSDGDPTGQKE